MRVGIRGYGNSEKFGGVMIRKVLQILSFLTVIALLAACSKAQTEDKKVSGKPVVFVEETSVAESELTDETTETEAYSEEAYDTEPELAIEYDSVDEEEGIIIGVENDDVVIDEDYLKVCPPRNDQESFDTEDTSYRDELTDDILLEYADKWHDEGYMILSADKMAENGAAFTVKDGYYFYRGFMAAKYDQSNSEVRYYFVMSQDLMFELMDQFAGFSSGFKETEDSIVFDFGDTDGISLTYDKNNQVMEYVMWATR